MAEKKVTNVTECAGDRTRYLVVEGSDLINYTNHAALCNNLSTKLCARALSSFINLCGPLHTSITVVAYKAASTMLKRN